MDRIQDLLSRLADLSDADIAELEGLILTEFDSVESQDPTTESVEQMVSLADALDTVRGETSRRTEAADALSAKRSEVAARVHGTSETEDQPPESEMAARKADDEEETTPDAAAAGDDLPDTPAPPDPGPAVTPAEVPPAPVPEEGSPEEEATEDQATEDEEDDEEKKKIPPTFSAETDKADADEEEDKKKDPPALSTEPAGEASADEPQENHMTAANDTGAGVVITPPADAAPVPARNGEGVGLTITAGADIPGFGTGSVLTDMDVVADAFAKRLHTLRNANGSGLQHVIATLSFEYPETRQLRGDNSDNINKITKYSTPELVPAGQQGLTAAAAICSPLEDYFDFTVCGVDDRPIRDALVRFNADRGGLRIYPLPTLDPSPGIGIWDPAAPTVKTCVDAVCPTPDTVGLEAIYACIKFSNYTNRFFPEVIKANTDLAMIHHARVSELNLIKKIYAQCTQATVKDVPDMGITRSLVRAISDAAAYLRRLHRLDVNGPIRVILPNWMLDAMIADLAQQMPGDGLEVLNLSAQKITSLFSGRGINITWALDDWDATGGQASPPSPVGQGFETAVSFPMYPEGSFLFLDGGTLDLGVQRDMTMVGDNEYATFVETFEGVAKIKCEALWLTMNVCVSGTAAALVAGVC
jgi:hypothetical protein